MRQCNLSFGFTTKSCKISFGTNSGNRILGSDYRFSEYDTVSTVPRKRDIRQSLERRKTTLTNLLKKETTLIELTKLIGLFLSTSQAVIPTPFRFLQR